MPDNRTPLYASISSLLGPTQAADEEFQAATLSLAAKQAQLKTLGDHFHVLESKVQPYGQATWAERLEYAQLGPQVEQLTADVQAMFNTNVTLSQKFNELLSQMNTAVMGLRL